MKTKTIMRVHESLCWLAVSGMLAFGSVWAYSIIEWFSIDKPLSPAAMAAQYRQNICYFGLVGCGLFGILVNTVVMEILVRRLFR